MLARCNRIHRRSHSSDPFAIGEFTIFGKVGQELLDLGPGTQNRFGSRKLLFGSRVDVNDLMAVGIKEYKTIARQRCGCHNIRTD